MRFRADNLTIGSSPTAEGSEVQVQVDVTNLTTSPQEYNAVLWVNDQVNLSQGVLIAPSTPETITFSTQLGPGDYTVRVDRLLDALVIKPDRLCQFDTDGNEAIERPEAVEAATNYLLGRGSITRNEAVAVVTAYLLEQRFACR